MFVAVVGCLVAQLIYRRSEVKLRGGAAQGLPDRSARKSKARTTKTAPTRTAQSREQRTTTLCHEQMPLSALPGLRFWCCALPVVLAFDFRAALCGSPAHAQANENNRSSGNSSNAPATRVRLRQLVRGINFTELGERANCREAECHNSEFQTTFEIGAFGRASKGLH